MVELLHGDCLERLQELPDCSVDACVTDPPYGLRFMGKAWDYDVPQAEVWREVLRVLKPGGHLLAFAGTRTQHRMAVNIEDAGFEIRDMIAWLYGSGFPKSHNISVAIDKAAGAEREVVGQRTGAVNPKGYKTDGNTQSGGAFAEGEFNITAPATEAASNGTAGALH
jgi:DNA modification methylase